MAILKTIKGNWRVALILFSVIAAGLVFFWVGSNFPKGSTRVFGAVSQLDRDGSLTDLGGIEVFILSKRIGSRVIKVRDGNQENSYLDLREDLLEIREKHLPEAVASGQADAEGRYEIDPVPAGNYYAYAHYITPRFSSWWIIPVKLEDGVEYELDLGEQNTTEVYYK